MTAKPNKSQPPRSQRRAQAVAKRQKAAEAAARQRRNRTLLWGGVAVVVVVAVVVAVLAGGGGDDANATKWETAPVTVDGTPLPDFDSEQSPDPAIGDTMPTLDGKSIFDGTRVTITPNGKPQVIVFLAHYCPHCQAEVPRIVSLADQGVFDGVDVTGVATGTNEAAPNYPPSAWLDGEDWPFSVMADSPSGTAATAYGLPAYPYFVLVDADGTVVGRATGEISEDDLEANIEALKQGEPLPLTSSDQSTQS